MSLEAYQIFDAVVREKSFIKAAEAISLSPSAISHSVSGLENRLGVKLFNRSRGGVSLTSAGRDIAPYIETIVKSENLIQKQIKMMTGDESGTVRIGLFNSISINWMTDIIRDMRENHPGIDVLVNEGSYCDVDRWIEKKAVDIAFVSMNFYKGDDAIILYRDRLVCVGAEDFEPENGRYVSIEEIKSARRVDSYGLNSVELDDFFDKYGIQIKNDNEITTDQTHIVMAECGLGMCILPEMNLTGTNAHISIHPIETDPHRTLGLVLTDPEFATPAALRMYGSIQQTVKRLTEEKQTNKR